MRTQLLLALSLCLPFSATASDLTKFNPKGSNSVKAVKLDIDQQRVLVLRGPVLDANINVLNSDFKTLIMASNSPVYLIIDSPGGSIDAGMRFINTIIGAKREFGAPTICIVENDAYSMAAIIAAYCHQTYMLPTSGLLYHEASYGVQGQTTQILSRVVYMTLQINLLQRRIAAQIGIPAEDFLGRIKNEWWLTARSAVRFGLVDGLVETVFYTAEPPEVNAFELIMGRASGRPWLEQIKEGK